MSLRRSLRARNGRDDPPNEDSNLNTRATRRNRATASVPSVTVWRAPDDFPGDSTKSIRLTVKMPSSKLREVTRGGRSGGSRRSVNVFTEDPIVTGPRTSRNRKKLVEINTSDEEEDSKDQDEDDFDDEDAPGDGDEDADADGDLDMDEAPPRPPVSRRQAKAAPTSAPSGKGAKSVEEKEMEMEEDEGDDDEELSEPDSDAEGEPDDQDESGTGLAKEEDDELDDDLDDVELDSDDEGQLGDPNKMTKRQRGNLGNDFLQLPMEPQVKKHLTAEERAMRRAEMARRRKNLSEKRNEEEKMDTINRLLRKQAPKRRGRVPAAEAAEASADQEMPETEKADPIMVRWISGRENSKVCVPEEWLGTPAGRVFGKELENRGSSKMVEEV